MIAIQRADAAAIARIKELAKGWTIEEMAHAARWPRAKMRRFLFGRSDLSLRAAKNLADVLRVSVTHLCTGGDPALEDRPTAWLLAVLKVRRAGRYRQSFQVPSVPQAVTLITDKLVAIRWSPWSCRVASAAEIRKWDHLKPGPGIRAGELTTDGLICHFADRRSVTLMFEDMAAMWPDLAPDSPRGWSVDAPGRIGTVSVMKKGDKQRKIATTARTKRRSPSRPPQLIEATEGDVPEGGWIGVPKAAEMLDVHEQTIRAYIHGGTIKNVRRLGPRLWKIPMSEIHRLMGTTNEPPKAERKSV